MQSLLYYKNPDYYTSGVYGWNADIYQIDSDTVIVTGYRPFGNIKIDYNTIKKYELEAKKIAYNIKNHDIEDKKEKIEKILKKLVENVEE